MLIHSPRQTKEDIECWREYESADLIHGRKLRESAGVAGSLAAIGDFFGNGRCYAGVSWGKDSVVLAHLLYRVRPEIPLIYLRQNTENPDCGAVRDAYFKSHPGQCYHEIPVVYSADMQVSHSAGPWKEAIAECARRYGRHYLGLRADESGGRMIRMRRWGLASPNGCAPLGWWSAADVFGYLAVQGLPVHPVYAMLGGGRWKRDRIRTASIGGDDGRNFGRAEWEREYYGDVLNRTAAP